MRGTVRPNALVAAYFDTLTPEQRETAQALQRAVLEAAPALLQSVKWGNLVFMTGRDNLMAIVAHKSHVNLQFFNGAALAAQFPKLEGTGKSLRHLKCRLRQPVDTALVQALVRAALEASKSGGGGLASPVSERTVPPRVSVPSDTSPATGCCGPRCGCRCVRKTPWSGPAPWR
ncbi:DUF1801 domain-containing protein [Caldimonas manganoxidans]|uniref:DUF1801 domain-containing protein n=2 Tax=Sphaerotilaceae TaxID=2975441 RepID=UPI00146C16F6|nr:DUF1801 domain-containing protein [Caldimonas manganoxidans]